MSENIVMSVKNITKKYLMGDIVVDALKGVSFDLYEGEFVVVLGASGSGKSTILNIIGGIDRATSGEVIYNNEDISTKNDKQLTLYRRSAVGFIFQFYNLVPNLTAKENILLASELSSNPLNVGKLIKDVDLDDKKDNFPAQMSGGQQQRVAIARALSKNPDILLCDEPTGALDVKTGADVLKLLKDFNETYNKTVVIITHNSIISEMADRVFYIKDGLLDKIEVNENPKKPEEVVW
ncbi:MAG: ABC transporter ATP-binding protein [Lachnospirales bacterium]